MDARTEHLIGLVKDGATLRDAGRVYGISGERVRQLLLAEGMTAARLPGRARSPRAEGFARAQELAPAIEAMWREGMLYHEIAEVFDVSCQAVHRLIWARLGDGERRAQTARRVEDGHSRVGALLRGMRRAADVLRDAPYIEDEQRRRAQAAVAGWLAAHAQLAEATSTVSSSERHQHAHVTSLHDPLSVADLSRQLERFKADLRAGGLKESTIHAYLVGTSRFLRWLGGDYAPRGR